jgi:hypothetical protein
VSTKIPIPVTITGRRSEACMGRPGSACRKFDAKGCGEIGGCGRGPLEICSLIAVYSPDGSGVAGGTMMMLRTPE